MNRGPGTLRTVMIVLGSSWFGFVLNILRVLVLPAKLGDLGLGDVTTAVSFTTFFGIFISLGTSIYLVRAVAQDQSLASRYLSNALVLRVVMGAGVLALLLGIAHLFGYAPRTQQVIMIVGVSMVIGTISNVFESGLQGLGQMSWRAIAMASGQVTATVTGVTMLLLGADVMVYALCIPLGAVVEFVVVLSYFFLHHPIKFSLDRSVMRALVVGGLPLFMWGVLQTAYGQIDATLLSLISGIHIVGWFGAATQITSVLIVIPTAITAVMLPMLCEMHLRPGHEFDNAATRTMVSTLLVMAPIGAGLAISAGDVLRVLPYPPAFLNAAPALALLGLALPVTGALMVLSTLAVAIGQEREWIKISAFAVCVFPPLYIVLINWFQTNQGNGATGTAVANLIGESALVVWAWLVLPARLRQTAMLRRGLQIAALTLLMVGVVAGLQRAGVPLFGYIPVAAALYFAGAWLLHLITPGDLAMVRHAVQRRGRRAPATAGQG